MFDLKEDFGGLSEKERDEMFEKLSLEMQNDYIKTTFIPDKDFYLKSKKGFKMSDKHFAFIVFIWCLAMAIYCHYHITDLWACFCILCGGTAVLIGWWDE